MRHYGLIGKKLGHSWSADYFARKFAAEGIDADYRLIELGALWEGIPTDLDGYNVTIPYKTAIIPYLDHLDGIAAEIGAVNCVKDGVGYNTDFIGVVESLKSVCEHSDTFHRHALILGRGGAAKAVRYALKVMGITSEMVDAHGTIEADVSQYGLIANATPLGMYPDAETYPDIDYASLKPQQVLFDCVYNPEETVFMQRGKEQGCTVIGGLTMLHAQAEASFRLWFNVEN